MTDRAPDEFNDVTWDIPSSSQPEQSKDAPAVVDPLLDTNNLAIETTAYTHTQMTPKRDEEQSLKQQETDSSAHEFMPEALHAESSYQQDNPSAFSSSKISNDWKSINVTEPRKEVEGGFISYLIVSANTSVRRRFQDFVWLYNVLYINYPACFIPPLPDKHRMEYVKGDRFSSEFIERRRVSLQRFLQRIARHPILGHSEFFTMFLESPGFNDASARAMREGQETMMDAIGDSLLNAFAKIRKKDERFIEMRERVDRLEDNLSLLERTLSRTNKRSEAQDLYRDYHVFAESVKGLARHEDKTSDMLIKFAEAVDQYSQHMKIMTSEDAAWLSEIHDYHAYYNAMKGVLKLRDQKQLDFEELSEYLQSSLIEREKILHPRPGDYNLTEYFTGKLNEVRGADADKLRREKILRLDERIHELQEAVEQTQQVSIAFSEQVKREDDFLSKSKAIEIREALESFTTAKVDFYQQGARIWREVVQTLEQLD